MVYKFPESAKFGKMLAKSKIYGYATLTSKVKKLFVAQVEKITWDYKLSPATINLPGSDSVQEIQVFHVVLRTGVLASEILQTIDKAIPSPILFLLQYKGKCRYVAAHKRPSEADKNKWVVSNHFKTDWMNASQEQAELPVVLNMEALYHFFSGRLFRSLSGKTKIWMNWFCEWISCELKSGRLVNWRAG